MVIAFLSPLIPLSIQVKEVNCSYSIDKVFSDITSLQHGNDGLIYTSVSTPYIPGTDRNLYVFFLFRKSFVLTFLFQDSNGNRRPRIRSTLSSFCVSHPYLAHQTSRICMRSLFLHFMFGVGVMARRPLMNPGTQCMSMTKSGKGMSRLAGKYSLPGRDE
jgi:hypothetical protein